MGIYSCKKHGLQGFHEMCEHVYASFQKGIYPKFKELLILNTLLCENCWEHLGAHRVPHITLEEVLDLTEREQKDIDAVVWNVYYNIPGRKCMCIKCIAEIKTNASRN